MRWSFTFAALLACVGVSHSWAAIVSSSQPGQTGGAASPVPGSDTPPASKPDQPPAPDPRAQTSPPVTPLGWILGSEEVTPLSGVVPAAATSPAVAPGDSYYYAGNSTSDASYPTLSFGTPQWVFGAVSNPWGGFGNFGYGGSPWNAMGNWNWGQGGFGGGGGGFGSGQSGSIPAPRKKQSPPPPTNPDEPDDMPPDDDEDSDTDSSTASSTAALSRLLLSDAADGPVHRKKVVPGTRQLFAAALADELAEAKSHPSKPAASRTALDAFALSSVSNPEPATLAVFGLMAVGGLGYVRRRKPAR